MHEYYNFTTYQPWTPGKNRFMDWIVIWLDFEFVKGFHLNQSSTVWPLNETEEALGNRNTFGRDQVVESLRSFGTAWPPPGCVRSPILKRFGALEACERWCRIATLTSSKMKSNQHIAANHSEWDHISNPLYNSLAVTIMSTRNRIAHHRSVLVAVEPWFGIWAARPPDNIKFVVRDQV